ncbi:MAG: non-homologous end-joining DNA ligase [Deltaproteobacteria bacterium]|nr:non-homologous end-joining DNA ligase [Deltaproteobacteria bacterium]
MHVRAALTEAVEIGGRTLALSSLDKLLYPAAQFRKRHVIVYYRAVAPVLLPHLADRPLHLARFPDGVEAPGWLQANCRGAPAWLRTHTVTGKRGQTLRFCVIDDEAALVWAANLGTLELHPFHWTLAHPDEPRALVFDLDPGPGCTLAHCADAALAIREAIAPRLACVKTSGVKGLHVFVPLNGGATFADAKAFARQVAADLAARHAWLTDKMPLRERTNRVFIDTSQNGPGHQTVAPYSLRATTVPLVSAPLAWDELATAAPITPADAVDRIARHGDLFAEVLSVRQTL